jgi:hypothetical protein
MLVLFRALITTGSGFGWRRPRRVHCRRVVIFVPHHHERGCMQRCLGYQSVGRWNTEQTGDEGCYAEEEEVPVETRWLAKGIFGALGDERLAIISEVKPEDSMQLDSQIHSRQSRTG